MRRIDVGSARGPQQLTAMVVGDSRAGKTYFGAGFPRPFFLMDASEHGWTTLDYMPIEALYEPDRVPAVLAIETPEDMMTALVGLKQQAKGEKVDFPEWPIGQGVHEVGTIIIDSLTFYADAYFSTLESDGGGKKDARQMYGALHSHLRYLMIQFHQLPYHVVWTCLPKDGSEGGLGGALIAGQTAAKAPARCDLWLYLSKNERRVGQVVTPTFEAHTQNYAGNKAGHRFGDLLSPVMTPSFRAFETALGLEPWLNRLPQARPASAKQAPAAAAAPARTAWQTRRRS